MANQTHKDHLVKIKYDYDIMPEKERGGFLMALLSIAFIFIPLITTFSPRTDLWTKYHAPFYIAIGVGMLGYGLYVALPSFMGRHKSKKARKEAVKNGKKVIGEIVSLYKTEINGHNEKNFAYTVEYESPNEGKTTTLITPWSVRGLMFVREKDLPIKVTIYLYKHTTIVHELINPPVIKMYTRKYFNGIFGILAIIIMAAAIPLFPYNPMLTATVLVVTPVLLVIIVNHKKI